ncbi:MAG: TonB-dependent receptor [Myxococcales bacterium]|nr:TonB-dependent receptor [Myxococcales bacterium]
MHRKLLSLVLLVLAVAIANPARADTKADARKYFQRGMAFIDSGQYRQGIEELEKAYQIRPHRNVLFNIGRAYASWGRTGKAIEYFERYLATDPKDREGVEATLEELRTRQRLRTLVDQGMREIKAGRHLEGVALLRRAYKERPHPNLLFNIARAYEDAGQDASAIDYYRRYLRSNPRDARDVQARLTSLEERRAEVRRRREAQARAEQPPPPTSRRGGRTRTPEPEEPAPPPSAAPGGPAKLDDGQLDRIANLIIERMKAEGAFDRPAAPAETAQVEPEAHEGTLPIDTSPQEGDVKSATVAVGTSVELAAKGGEAYEEVVVTASRRAESPLDAPNAVTVLTEEDIRLSGARTIPDLLRRVPGMDVMAMSYAEYDVAMRGFNRRLANKILVLIDGRTAYQDFLGATLWRSFPIDILDVERIEVVRGPGSAIYGAYAYTGIINIITKTPEAMKGALAQVGAGNGKRLEAVFQYGDTKGPFGFKVSGGYDRGDKYELEFDPDRVDYTGAAKDPNLSLQVARVDGEIEYNVPDGSGRFFLGGHVVNGSTELFGVATLRNLIIDQTQLGVRGGYNSDLVSVRMFYNRLDADASPQFYRTGLPSLGSVTDFDLLSVEPVFRPELELFGKHAIVLGGEYRFKHIKWDYLNDEQNENHFALFFQDTWTVTSWLSAIVSARLDLHPLIGPLGSPRLAVIYKPAPNQALRLSVGTAFRQPTMAETYLDLRASSPVAGALVRLVGGFEGLDPEAIATIDLGYRWQPEWGELEVVAYANRVTNLITRTAIQPTGADEPFDPEAKGYVIGNSFYINDPDTYLALGSELSARLYPVDGLDVGASYAFQYIFNTRTNARFTDSPLHKVSVWGQLRTQFGLDMGVSVHFVSNQAWVDPQYDLDDPSGFDATPLPLDASVVVIGRVGYRLFNDKLELGVSGTNLTDFGGLRHREHPFGNQLEARILGTVTGRF